MKDGIKRYKNNDCQWRFKVNLQIEGIRFRKQNFFTKKEASAFLERMRLIVLTGQYESFVEDEKKKKLIASSVSFKEFAAAVFQKKCRDIRPSTKRRYWHSVVSNLFPVIGSKKVVDITSADYEKVKETMMSAGSSRASVNLPISALIYILKRARGEGQIECLPENPVSFVMKKRNLFLTDDELKGLLMAVETMTTAKTEWIKVYVHLQLNTFTRVGEMLALKWSDVDFHNGTIAINKQIDAHTLKLGFTKNNKIHTALPLSNEILLMLKKWKIKCGGCSWLFPSGHYFSKDPRSKNKLSADIKPMRKGGVHRMLKLMAAAAGIDPKRLSSHVLRKTAGDRLLRQGFTVHQVAHALRIDAKTILWTYSTLDENAFNNKLAGFELLKTGNAVATNDDKEFVENE